MTDIAVQYVSMQPKISTRDGGLGHDGKMVNCFKEPEQQGEFSTVKRPGTMVLRTFAGTPQGQFLWGGVAYSIINETIINIDNGTSFVIPSVTVPGQQYSTLSDVPAGTSILKSPSGMWIFNGTAAVKVTDPNYPNITVPGVTYMDGTYYIMDSDGNVRGSALTNPASWPALNFIAADATLGGGIGINRHLNYIEAFYQHGLQLYYDAGQSPGIPLAAVGNASWTTGAIVGTAIVELSDTTIWVAKNREFGRTVQMLSGLQMFQVSNPYIEKILNRSNFNITYSYGMKVAGHSFFILTMVDIGVTLCFDLILQEWYNWTSVVNGVEQYFVGVNYVSSVNNDLLQDLSTGSTLVMSIASNSDSTGPIYTRIVTEKSNWGTLHRKQIGKMFMLADTNPTTITVQYTDDDYQTFSTPRTIDLSTVRKMLQRCGSTRERAWQIFHSDNQPLKLYKMQLELTVGPS